MGNQEDFCQQFSAVKRNNKLHLATLIKQHLNIEINVDSIFDIHIKRIHEYKRQLLNVLHVITLYNRIRHNPDNDITPRTIIFAGKAAPAYHLAKLIIRLINNVADIINNDPAIGNKLKVVFLPNYNVSLAEEIIPACDLSEQISTAGTEASGTGNMKFSLNGALTIGTLDGANVEIMEEVGKENIFIFGKTTDEVEQCKRDGYNPFDYYQENPELKEVLDMIGSGYFSTNETNRFQAIIDTLTSHGDHYLVLADYAAYVSCQEQVAKLYRDQDNWTHKAILNTANMGKFSSDRTIKEYAKEIWNTSPINIQLIK